MRKLEISSNERLEQRAKEILTTAVHRLGNSVVSDVLATTVALPNDEIKGKIIGKEGRNIRALSARPASTSLSTTRRARLHSPRMIRFAARSRASRSKILFSTVAFSRQRSRRRYKRPNKEINTIIKKKGTEAAYEARVPNLDPKLLMILGRLYFRSSYGQNVLDHSVEVAHLAGCSPRNWGPIRGRSRWGALPRHR